MQRLEADRDGGTTQLAVPTLWSVGAVRGGGPFCLGPRTPRRFFDAKQYSMPVELFTPESGVATTIPGAFLLGPLVGVKKEAREGAVDNLVAMGVPKDVAHQYARIIEDSGVAIIADVPEQTERDVR